MSHQTSSDPVLILAAVRPDGTATNSPMFAAVKVTAELCCRLRALASLSAQNGIDVIQARHTDAPIYWDVPPGSTWDGCIEEHTDWFLAGSTLRAQLTGRAFSPSLGYSNAEVIAQTTMVDVSDLEHMRAAGYDVDFREAAGTEDLLGQPFAVAVVERIAELKRQRASG